MRNLFFSILCGVILFLGITIKPLAQITTTNKDVPTLIKDLYAVDWSYDDNSDYKKIQKALVNIGPKAVPYLIEELRLDKSQYKEDRIIEVIQEIGISAVPSLVSAIEKPDIYNQTWVESTFRYLDLDKTDPTSKEVVPDLRRCLCKHYDGSYNLTHGIIRILSEFEDMERWFNKKEDVYIDIYIRYKLTLDIAQARTLEIEAKEKRMATLKIAQTEKEKIEVESYFRQRIANIGGAEFQLGYKVIDLDNEPVLICGPLPIGWVTEFFPSPSNDPMFTPIEREGEWTKIGKLYYYVKNKYDPIGSDNDVYYKPLDNFDQVKHKDAIRNFLYKFINFKTLE